MPLGRRLLSLSVSKLELDQAMNLAPSAVKSTLADGLRSGNGIGKYCWEDLHAGSRGNRRGVCPGCCQSITINGDMDRLGGKRESIRERSRRDWVRACLGS